MPSMKANPLLEAALAYAARGWPVVPLHTPRDGSCTCARGQGCEHAGKHPRPVHGIKEATTAEATVRDWWGRWPQANVGIATGATSGLVVIDIDPRHGGEESLAKLEGQHGPLPATAEAVTGGGGRHLYFRHPSEPTKNSTGKLGDGLDVKAGGGAVVAPPSLHATGKWYQWRPGHGPDDLPLADLPGWLLERLHASEPKRPPAGTGEGAKVSEGARNSTLASLAGSMRAKGMVREAIEAALLTENMVRCAPPLSEEEVRAIAQSIGGYPPGEPETDEVERLARISVPDYERAREKAAKTLGMRIGILDGLVAQRRREIEAATRGGGLADALEPWPDPIDGAELLGALRDKFQAHVVFPDHGAQTAALWVLFAHAHDAFQISPILAAESPEKRCGKTTLLAMLEGSCPTPVTAANITPAATFRVIEAARPTLLIDEADSFLRDNEELRGILNSGHARHSAFVWRVVGDVHEVQRFSTWAPKAIALIGELPDTLQDRSIVVRLRRKLPLEKVERFRTDRLDDLRELARKAARWAADNRDALRAADPDVPSQLHDRAADNWRPLLAIADRAGGPWPELARKAALTLSGVSAQEDEPTAGVRALVDCREVFEQAGADALPPAEVVKRLHELPEAPWSEWRHGKPLSPRGLARLLKPFDIRSTDRTRLHGPLGRYYVKSHFADAWNRYLSPTSPFPSETSGTSLKSQEIAATASGTGVPDRKSQIPNEIRAVPDVSDRTPPVGEEQIAPDEHAEEDAYLKAEREAIKAEEETSE